jgi:DNA-binding transcriptional MerR regulator
MKKTEPSYKIGDLARMFGVTVRTIRYYEELKLIEPERRDGQEHRRYPARSAVHLKRVQQLKDYGLSLSEISELFELARADRSGGKVRGGLISMYGKKLAEARKKRAAMDSYMEDLAWHIQQLERVEDFFQCPGSSCDACPFLERCDVRMLREGGEGA